jgi:anti-sigma B factor antagonist
VDLVLGSTTQGSWTIIQVAGELDLYTSPTLRDDVLSRIEAGQHHLAIDLQQVTFMDSSTLGVLVACLKRMRERGGDITLLGVEGSPLKVLTLTGLDRVFTLIPSAGELPRT